MYWNSQIATWIVIPFLQDFSVAGGYSFWTRVQSSLKSNAWRYLLMALGGVIFVAYLVFYVGLRSVDAVVGLAVALGNAYGLLLGMVFLGHGLVGIPRELWAYADTTRLMEHYEVRAMAMKDDVESAEYEVQDLLKVLITCSEQFQN